MAVVSGLRCRKISPISLSERPRRNISHASVWRNKCAPFRGASIPARVNAWLTICHTSDESLKSVQGAFASRNTRLVFDVRGRPRFRYAAIAFPTSAGNGNWSNLFILPRIVMRPFSQSISSSVRLITSAARRPRRASSSKIA